MIDVHKITKTAVLNARQTGLELLIGMGSYPEIPGIPYL